MKLSLRDLQYITVLDEERNFARAAERVFLSQPAFSRSIRSFEDMIGLQLFDRGTRHVLPTECGKYVIERARRILKESRSLQHDIGLLKSSDFGTAKIGVSPSIACGVFHDALIEMRTKHPAVLVDVIVSNWREMLDLLLKERIEFFIAGTADIDQHPDIEITSTGRQRGAFYCRKSHPLVGRRRLNLDDIRPYGIGVAHNVPVRLQKQLLAIIGTGKKGEELPISLVCDDFSVLRAAVLNTDLLMVQFPRSAQEDLRDGKLVELPALLPRRLYAEFGVVQLADRSLAPATAVLKQVVMKAALAASEM